MAALHALDAELRERRRARAPVSCAASRATSCRGLPRRTMPQRVHISADFGPYGRRRDERVAHALSRRRSSS